MRDLWQNRDEARILEKLDITNTFIYSVLDSNSVISNHINAQVILKERKYPSPKNLKVLFNRLGIKYIFDELNRKGQKDYQLLLRSFLDIRETIAHQESTSLTFTDVQRHFKNISDFIDKADRVLYSPYMLGIRREILAPLTSAQLYKQYLFLCTKPSGVGLRRV